MKLIALHDEEGRILAAVQYSDGHDGPVPVAAEGTTVTELDIPDEHAHLGLGTICRRFRVHPKRKQLVELGAGTAE
jgi:hypothetical protein